MEHTKIIERSDKSKVKIRVQFKTSYSSVSSCSYDFDVYILPPRKRIWINVSYELTQSYLYRKLGNVERREAILNKQLEYVTKEEIYAAKLELWQKLKPIE